MSAVTGKTKPNLWVRIGKFLREVKSELKKVAWPNRKELVKYTIIVLTVVIIIAVYIGIVDFLMSNLLALLSRIGG